MAVIEHAGGESVNDGLSLDVKVPDHRVAMPAAKHLNDVAVDVGAHEGHSATRPEGSRADLSSGDASDGLEGGGRSFEPGGDIEGSDTDETVGFGGVVGGNGKVVGCALRTMVQEESDGGLDGATQWVVGTAMAEGFIPNAILLSGKGVGCGGGCRDVTDGGRGDVEATIPMVELDVLEEERLVGMPHTGVLAGAQEVVERDGDEVGDDHGASDDWGCMGRLEDMEDEGDRHRLDADGRGVVPVVTAQLSAEAKVDLAEGVEPGVPEPQ